jgi:hypothetical protein
LLKQARRAICWNEPMPYFLQLTRIRENRLKVQCNETGTNYSVINDMLSRMLRWGAELDLNPGLEPMPTGDEVSDDLEKNIAAMAVLREVAAEHKMSHREAAFMLLDTWSGQRGASPEDYRGKGWKYPVTINIQNENGEILSTMVL